MKNLNKILLVFMCVAFSAVSFAQTSISGTITNKDDGSALAGVTVVAKGTTIGTISNLDGKYEINIPEGTQFLIFSYFGMETQEVAVTGSVIDVQLYTVSEELIEVYVIADRAKERETPVAFSDVTKEDIEFQLGSRDIPMVMNMTPSVYATVEGGGAGDSRINIRGFSQRNVAVMINGVPMNDMENGWVYWSNWDGLGDVSNSMQIQRGLSAINLATPSIGGTMNIVTSPADKKAGGSAKLEYGSGNFFKGTVSYNTGLIKDRLAMSFSLVGKQGNGVVDKTWTQGAAYYFGATFKASNNQKLDLFALGAPQRHGQNYYMQNIAAYGHDIAAGIEGYDIAAFDAFPESNASESYPGFDGVKGGRFYNETWSPVSTSYTGKQWWNGKEHSRYGENFISERENYFHKPLVNLNWYASWTDKIKQYTTIYYSGGKGGGSGTAGSLRWNYNEDPALPSPSRFVAYDLTIQRNTDNGPSLGIIRNSVNNQWTIGAISRAVIKISEKLKAQVGIDWRTAQVDHFREVRDLLGGTYYYNASNEFDTADTAKVLGDIIEYNFTNTIDWIGYFAQAEYTTQKITAYATFGHSFIKYNYTNHFVMDDNGNELAATVGYIPGYQIKGGLSYRPIGGFSVFANYGYVSKVPIFDAVIDDVSAYIAESPKNEVFNSIEGGVSYQTTKRDLDIKVNYYYTNWKDRTISRNVTSGENMEAIVFITGMGQLHQGVEFEVYYKPIKYVEIGALASFGKWEYTTDVNAQYREYVDGGFINRDMTIATNGLKVGDMPQTQFAGMLIVKPINDLRIQFDARYYKNHYADFDPLTREYGEGDTPDRTQVWLTPSYFIADLHLTYALPLKGKLGVEVFAHVFNLLDGIYIQDATDNSAYNAYKIDGEIVNPHKADAAEVYLGLPRTFNAGVKLTF
jgi:iron complex outermembrane receptor protein